jgi:putative addiction module component (TIGR02574 family)
MSTTAEQVLQAGLQLPVEDRKRIVRELWNSLPDESQFEFDEGFWAEMERRQQELKDHPEIALTHEEVME